jgi:hypothetical protein
MGDVERAFVNKEAASLHWRLQAHVLLRQVDPCILHHVPQFGSSARRMQARATATTQNKRGEDSVDTEMMY